MLCLPQEDSIKFVTKVAGKPIPFVALGQETRQVQFVKAIFPLTFTKLLSTANADLKFVGGIIKQ